MANRYVWSGAAGAGTGADWANAYTTFALAATGGSAGDTYYVAHDHAESTAASITPTFKGTTTTPDRILSVNRAGSVPPAAADLLAGASVSTTGASNNYPIGVFYCWGVTFNAGSAASAANMGLGRGGGASTQIYENCSFNLTNSSGSSRVLLGQASTMSRVVLINCTMSFGSTSQGFQLNSASLRWSNKPGSTAITGATLPTTLILSNNFTPWLELDGLDLSALGSGKTIVGAIVGPAEMLITNCKLGASVTVASTPSSTAHAETFLIGSSSAGNVQRNEIYRFQGTLTTETTIVRTGGASDGATAYSWKIAATADNERDFPFETFEGAVWNTTTGSAKTLTVHTVTDNVTLTDAEIWLEVEYLGSSATPVSTLITDANATVLTTAANQATSTETWTTTGLGTPVYQKLEVTFTPEMAGPIRWRVKVAKVSTTVYICPKAEIS